MNFAEEFFERGGSFWKIEEAEILVKDFVEAAHSSGWHMEIFIDSGISSKEAMEKWSTRREDDVR